MVKSAKCTGSHFGAVKLCLQSKGHQHQCSWKGQRKQNWKPPWLHSQFTALLPKSIWDLSKHTGHWHQLDSWTSPPRPHQLAASSAGCQSSHTFVLSPSPQPAKKDASSSEGQSWLTGGAEDCRGPQLSVPFSLGTVSGGQDVTPARAAQCWSLWQVTQWQR